MPNLSKHSKYPYECLFRPVNIAVFLFYPNFFHVVKAPNGLGHPYYRGFCITNKTEDFLVLVLTETDF